MKKDNKRTHMAKKQSDGVDKAISAAIAKHSITPPWAAFKSTLMRLALTANPKSAPGAEELFAMILSKAEAIAKERNVSPDDVVLEAIQDTCRKIIASTPGAAEKLEAERLADSKSRRRIPIRDKNGDIVEVVDVPWRGSRE